MPAAGDTIMIGFIQNLGWGEILAILLVVILLFGAKRIPDLARSLGRSLSEFKKGQADGASEKSAGEDGDSTGNGNTKPQ